MENKRLEYLDILKGIAIFFVVFEHVAGGYSDAFSMLAKFNIPIFFIVSGYLFYNKEQPSMSTILWKKLKQLVIPFAVFSVFACWYHNIAPLNYITDIGKCGYWFLPALFFTFVLYMVMNKIPFLRNRIFLIGGVTY